MEEEEEEVNLKILATSIMVKVQVHFFEDVEGAMEEIVQKEEVILILKLNAIIVISLDM